VQVADTSGVSVQLPCPRRQGHCRGRRPESG